jgi:hypothetical protein
LRNPVTGGTTASSVWADALRNLKRDELAAIVVDPVGLALLEAAGRKMKPPRGRSEMIELAVREYLQRHAIAIPPVGNKSTRKRPKK